MARNTNINDILFQVEEQRVFLEGKTTPIPGYKAISGKFNDGSINIFSIVSDGYRLIRNEEALVFGKQLHQKLFPKANADSFEIFNINVPKTKSFCHIDIIDKNYKLNVFKQEIYLPFIRIHNSYNRSRSLQFDIGFCRALCDNGAIFEQESVKLKFPHTKHSFLNGSLENINVDHLKLLEADFIAKTKRSNDIVLPEEYFVPLAAKTLNRVFDADQSNKEKVKQLQTKIEQFTQSIKDYTDRYVRKEEMGETAYAFYNVLTDYASNNEQSKATAKNGLQTKCGLWINQVGELVAKPGFKWEDEIKDYEYLLQY